MSDELTTKLVDDIMEFFATLKYALVPVNELLIDSSYQRKVKPGLVKKIQEHVDAAAFGCIIAGRRETQDTIYFFTVDGQQRAEAAAECGIPKLPTLYFPSTGPKREAEVYALLNGVRKNITALELHKAKLRSRIPSAVEIQQCIEAHNFRVAQHGEKLSWPIIKPIRMLNDIYRIHGLPGVDWVLSIIASFDDSTDVIEYSGVKQPVKDIVVSNDFFVMVKMLLGRWGPCGIDKSRVIRQLQNLRCGNIFRSMPSKMDAPGSTGTRMAEQFIHNYYNCGLSAKKRLVTSLAGMARKEKF